MKTRPATYQMVFAGVLRVPEHAGREKPGYRPYAEAYVRLLEGCVRDHPFQFFNFYDLWAVPGGRDDLANTPANRHCEEQRDEAIS